MRSKVMISFMVAEGTRKDLKGKQLECNGIHRF